MRRREFITLLGSTAVTWPFAARAQQPAMPVIGFLNGASYALSAHLVRAFHQGLSETGYAEGRNVAIEYRSAEGQYNRLPALAADLVRQQVNVITATGTPTGLPAKAATTRIPIVFVTGSDPVDQGLVGSLNRPGGNLTGATTLAVELGQKRLELLHELVPKATLIGVLVNPTGPNLKSVSRDLQEAARIVGLPIHVLHASTEGDLDTVFATLVQLRAGGLVIGSYAGSITDAYRVAGVYTGRILKGEKPSDLPVQQSTKAELFINLKTAKSLRITIPSTLLARADEVIE